MSKKLLQAAIIVGVFVLAGFTLTTTTTPLITSEVPVAEVPTPRAQATTNKDSSIVVSTLRLSSGNAALLTGVIEGALIDYVIANLQAATDAGAERLYLVIDSPGGSVFAGVKLINFIRSSRVPIYTVCNGMCASMAAHIHQVGTKRFATMSSVLMFHPAAGGVQGTLEGMLNQIQALKNLVDRLDANVASRAKMDYTVFKTKVSTELWLETVDALNEGFLDGVVNVIIPSVNVQINFPGGQSDQPTQDRKTLRLTM
jgi:ATP-dependent Clp protease protease subunit